MLSKRIYYSNVASSTNCALDKLFPSGPSCRIGFKIPADSPVCMLHRLTLSALQRFEGHSEDKRTQAGARSEARLSMLLCCKWLRDTHMFSMSCFAATLKCFCHIPTNLKPLLAKKRNPSCGASYHTAKLPISTPRAAGMLSVAGRASKLTLHRPTNHHPVAATKVSNAQRPSAASRPGQWRPGVVADSCRAAAADSGSSPWLVTASARAASAAALRVFRLERSLHFRSQTLPVFCSSAPKKNHVNACLPLFCFFVFSFSLLSHLSSLFSLSVSLHPTLSSSAPSRRLLA